MGKAKAGKEKDSGNWVPGWFGGKLTVKPSPTQFREHLKDRIAKSAIAKQASAHGLFEKAEADRQFGM